LPGNRESRADFFSKNTFSTQNIFRKNFTKKLFLKNLEKLEKTFLKR
jgi:hypothetical protein